MRRLKKFIEWLIADDLTELIKKASDLEEQNRLLKVNAGYREKEIQRLERWLDQAYAENDRLEDTLRTLRYRLSEQGRLLANRPVKLP